MTDSPVIVWVLLYIQYIIGFGTLNLSGVAALMWLVTIQLVQIMINYQRICIALTMTSITVFVWFCTKSELPASNRLNRSWVVHTRLVLEALLLISSQLSQVGRGFSAKHGAKFDAFLSSRLYCTIFSFSYDESHLRWAYQKMRLCNCIEWKTTGVTVDVRLKNVWHDCANWEITISQ